MVEVKSENGSTPSLPPPSKKATSKEPTAAPPKYKQAFHTIAGAGDLVEVEGLGRGCVERTLGDGDCIIRFTDGRRLAVQSRRIIILVEDKAEVKTIKK